MCMKSECLLYWSRVVDGKRAGAGDGVPGEDFVRYAWSDAFYSRFEFIRSRSRSS